MSRKIGPVDISYCSTTCTNDCCKRNIMYYKPPFRYFSCSSFDKNNKDKSHANCKYKLEGK